MKTPGAWEFALLALAALRLTRLIGWDDFPLVANVRRWAIGERWIPSDRFLNDLTEAMSEPISEEEAARPRPSLETALPPPRDPDDLGLPGKQPSTLTSDLRPAYRRPTLAHLVHCPFCIGWWVSLTIYGLWIAFPTETLYAAVPLALSSVVGLAAKNLDP